MARYALVNEFVTDSSYSPDSEKLGVLSGEKATILARFHQGSGSPTPAESEPSEAGVRTLLTRWVESFKQKDVSAQVNCYAPVVFTYYRKHNVTRDFVQANKANAFAVISEIRQFDLSNVRVQFDSEDQATVTLDKTWDTLLTSGKRYAGSENERLVLSRVGGEWLIKSEEEIKIYHVNH